MKTIVKTIAGSHLFGTNTPSSDMDHKGVFMPSAEEIILGSYPDTVRSSTGNDGSKNTSADVDSELYSLRKFFKMLENGDTAAIELLFTPPQFIAEKSELWDELVSIRDTLLSKKVNAMIGYARQQANKYGIKGSRMGELNNFLLALKSMESKHDFKGAKLKHSWDDIVVAQEDFRYVNIIEMRPTSDSTTRGIDILGKRFAEDTPMSLVTKNLSDEIKKYGQRAREAKQNNGVDFKALSHAIRVILQGKELLTTGQITLPHTGANLELIKSVKLGQMEYKNVEPIIEQLLADLERDVKVSKLPDDLNLDYLLLKYYTREIKG